MIFEFFRLGVNLMIVRFIFVSFMFHCVLTGYHEIRHIIFLFCQFLMKEVEIASSKRTEKLGIG